jgi:ankyrin repeat protein
MKERSMLARYLFDRTAFMVTLLIACILGIIPSNGYGKTKSSSGVNAQNDPYITYGRLMAKAIHNNDVRKVKLLLRNENIDPNGYTEEDGRYVHYIWNGAGNRKWQILELLLDAGANDCEPNTDEGESATLYFMAALGSAEPEAEKEASLKVFERVLKMKICNPNGIGHPRIMGQTALMMITATPTVDSRFLDLLIHYNANVNMTSLNGWTALHFAAVRGHSDIAKQLTVYNPDMTIKDGKGNTAIDWTHLERRSGAEKFCRVRQNEKGKAVERILLAAGSPPAREFPRCPGRNDRCIPCEGP